MMFSNVVVPLDGSKLAEGVLSHVAQIIHGQQSVIHLLSVSPLAKNTLINGRRSDGAPETVDLDHVEQQLTQYLKSTARGLEPMATDVTQSVRFGRPEETILDFAAEVEADLIVTSTHGRSGIRQWIFGTVADRLLRGAMCPVLLVRAGGSRDSKARPPALTALPGYRTILVPLDGSELAEQILPYVKALIRPGHSRVYLVSVLMTGLGDRTVTLLTSYPPGVQLTTTALRHAEVQSRTYLRGIAASLRKQGAPVQVMVREGLPADEILTYAEEIGAELVTMTTHGLSGISRWVYGNVARRVLYGAACPVLLVRPTPKQEE